MEQDDTSSCGSLSPLWSSIKDKIITIGDEHAEACEHVQVPEKEPHDELTTFLMEHRGWICTFIQADWPGWEDCLFSTLGRVLDRPGFRVEDRREPEPVPQRTQNNVDQHLQA